MKRKINHTTGFSTTSWRTRKFKSKEKTLNIATVFSGIGALEHAFKILKLKHNLIFAGDIDPHVKKTYFNNYKIEESQWHSDISKFKAKKFLGKVDLLMGGSPCQSFSMVGKRKGFDDSRGSLIHQFIRIVDECKPKVFIFENVKGLLSHDNGKSWEIIKSEFVEHGYSNIYPMVLNAKDYGIPQNRERVFIIGFRNKSKKMLVPKPVDLKITMQTLLTDDIFNIDKKHYLKSKGIKFVTSSKNRLKRYTQINGKIALCQKANQQSNWHGDFIFERVEDHLDFDEFIFNVEDIEEKYFLSDKVKSYVLAGGTKNYKTGNKTDLKIARPLLQTMHKMHRAGVDNYITYSKGRIRKLTPEECFRLMGFKSLNTDGVSDTQLYRQAGNSIVVDVIIAILKEMDITEYGR